jgi:predicted TIM-barrel fold metal-dependent hydrolase
MKNRQAGNSGSFAFLFPRISFASIRVIRGLILPVFLLCASAPLRETPLSAQEPLDGKDGRPLALDQFQPRSMLALPEHRPARAKFPAVDVHTHERKKLRQTSEALDEFVRLLDNQNIAVCVSLDGELGDRLEEHKQFLWTKYRDRFVIFANLAWQGAGRDNDYATWDCNRPDFARNMVAALEDAKQRGASGLKIFKEFGLVYRNADGSLIRVDDPRFDPMWEACGRLGLPVLIHTADPMAFWLPIDRFNERWEELRRHPDWSFNKPGIPSHDELLDELMRVVARHPKTNFIAAHMANEAENLAQLGRWLDEHPNLYVDIAARIAELGRQPRTARDFFLKYQDRILFGTDGPRDVKRLAPHWRLLETSDEYFPYAEDQYPPQGLWNIYGLDLPDGVLRKVYQENAVRLVPGVRERLEKQDALLVKHP